MNNVIVFAPSCVDAADDGSSQLNAGYAFSAPSGLQRGSFSLPVPAGTLLSGTAAQVTAALVAACETTVKGLFPDATGMIIVGGLTPVEF